MQLFLDHNPRYWCLVPKKLSEAVKRDDINAHEHKQSSVTRTDIEANQLRDALPTPMAGYHFSPRQRREQWFFFKNKSDLILPSMDFDLYHAAIVIVRKKKQWRVKLSVPLSSFILVPDDCSSLLRRFVEALLITHSESNLNIAGHLLHSQADYRRMTSDNPLARSIWLDGLTHPEPCLR